MLNELMQVIEQLKTRIEAHRTNLKANETRTRMALIDPLLQALGWDTTDPSLVVPEYNLSGKRADYALLNKQGSPIVFLEAKSLDENLSAHRSQVVAYASELGIRYPALSNGDQWEVYDNLKLVPIDQRSILSLSITDTSTHESALQLLLLWQTNLASGVPTQANQPIVWNAPTDQGTESALTPNDPEGGTASVTTVLSRGERYREFFKSLVDDLSERHEAPKAYKPSSKNHCIFPAGRTGFVYSASFAREGKARMELYIDNHDLDWNNSQFENLSVRKDEIESKLGALQWEKLDGRKACRIAKYTPGSIDDAETLNKTRDWMIKNLLDFKRVFGPILKDLADSPGT